ncbi:MAG: hypothetical protein IJB80_07460 [Clostridia bacterium]|nr:hypothetical protein [Clostridia bacterium]
MKTISTANRLLCLMVTISMLLTLVPMLIVSAAGEVAITAPATGSFLEVNQPVIIRVASALEPTLTANGTEVLSPVEAANGIWDFSWTPTEGGTVILRATDGTNTADVNVFAGITSEVSVESTPQNGATLVQATDLDETTDVVVLAFDAVFVAETDTLTVADPNGNVIVTLTATDVAGADKIKLVFDKTAGKQNVFLNDRQIAQTAMTTENLEAFTLSGVSVSNVTMRQIATPTLTITSPAGGTKAFVGDTVTVKAKTTGLPSGQAVKIVAQDGTEYPATQVSGTTDEYAATISGVTAGMQTLKATIASLRLESAPVSLTLFEDALLTGMNFNEGTENATGTLDDTYFYLYESKRYTTSFAYKAGKTGEGLAAYNAAPGGDATDTYGKGLTFDYVTIPQSGRVVYEFDARFEGKVIIRLMKNTTTYSNILEYTANSNGDIWSALLSSNIPNASYTHNGWNKHKIVLDLDNKTIDYYLDGNIKLSKQSCPFLAEKNAAKMLIFSNKKSTEGGVGCYIDNLNIYTTKEVTFSPEGGGTVESSVAFVSPSRDNFLEKGHPVTLKTNVTGAESVEFYAENTLIGTAPVAEGVASLSWTPDTEGTIELKAIAGGVTDTVSVEVVATTAYYFDSFNGPEIIENDNISTWNGSQNFDRYEDGGADGGKYGVMVGKGSNKRLLFHCPAPKSSGIYMVEMNIKMPANMASVTLENRHDSLGINEMFYVGTKSCGYHEVVDGTKTWFTTEKIPADTWVTLKYIENIDEGTRAIYINGVEQYSGPTLQEKHTTFGGLSFLLGSNWTANDALCVDNLRISTAAAPMFARSAAMVGNDTIRVNFSKTVSIRNLENLILVSRGGTTIPVTFEKGDKYLDLKLPASQVGNLSSAYTVVIDPALKAEDGSSLERGATFTVRSAGQSGNITGIQFGADGQNITSLSGLTAGQTITFTCNVNSSATAAQLILCVYTKNSNGSVALKQSAVGKGVLTANTLTPVSATLTLAENVESNDFMKVFVLNADGLVPLTDPLMLGTEG